MSETPNYACVEAGGTKFVVGIVSGDHDVREAARFPTTTPAETLSAVTEWLIAASRRNGTVRAAGVASFGPVSLDRNAADWGHIGVTPKPGWSGADIAGPIGRALDVPVGFDTDVNGAALAETKWGAATDQRVAVYVTVGTGIGGGIVVEGRTLRGLTHPEMGHIRLSRHEQDLRFAGTCPFHGDCLEGLASGPAIFARWGVPLSDLPHDHVAHVVIAHYIAQLCVNLQAMMEPGRIIVGGGVMATPLLLSRIQREAARLGGNYFKGDFSRVIVAPGLGDRSGLLGALALAVDAPQGQDLGSGP
ncbi:MAG: ROK family protein [Sphingopyxis sp.]|nr:ROK family protein [Sphingopyxis sp.]